MEDKLVINKKDFQEANIEFLDSCYNPPQGLLTTIDSYWRDINKKAKVWDGVVYRLASINDNNSIKTISINKISYKNHVSSHLFGLDIKNKELENLPNGIYVSAYIRTNDNKLIFSERSNSSILTRKYNLIGGTCNHDELKIKTKAGFFRTWKMELDEELKLGEESILDSELLGVYQTGRFRIAFVYLVDLNLSQSEVEKLVVLNNEHKRLAFIESSDFRSTKIAEDKYANIINTTKGEIDKILEYS